MLTSAAMKSNAARTAASASFTVSPEASAAAEATSFRAARGTIRDCTVLLPPAVVGGRAAVPLLRRGLLAPEGGGVDSRGVRRRHCMLKEDGRKRPRERQRGGARKKERNKERKKERKKKQEKTSVQAV